MVLYFVQWTNDLKLSRGKGRATKDYSFCFTVLCRNSSDAMRCLEYYFRHVFCEVNLHGFTLDDGLIHLQRMTIDSRNFTAHYLLLDGMREPIYLTDPASNVFRAGSIFGRL